jgi:hypothetical protein
VGGLLDDVGFDVFEILGVRCTNADTGESLAKTRIVVVRYDVM